MLAEAIVLAVAIVLAEAIMSRGNRAGGGPYRNVIATCFAFSV